MNTKPPNRRKLPLHLAFISATFAIMAVWPRAAWACSCVEYLTDPVEALEKSALVFSGEVVSVDVVFLPAVTYVQQADGTMTPSQYMERVGVVTLRTIREWKGNGAKTYVVLAGAPPVTPLPKGSWIHDCDEHLEVGQRYLVFTTDGYPEANPCAPTGPLEGRAKAVNALDAYAKATGTKPRSPR